MWLLGAAYPVAVSDLSPGLKLQTPTEPIFLLVAYHLLTSEGQGHLPGTFSLPQDVMRTLSSLSYVFRGIAVHHPSQMSTCALGATQTTVSQHVGLWGPLVCGHLPRTACAPRV